eukprot:TRINITY_DN2212_c0_g1_i1.p1 TRINITY_DN2212_c0_g1~~TRINITY_DN2212_c0_g1_i1.p1  ORF type:complete len:241 (-),score=45.80 TRINITY_DN2212_c0_g1_i1:283-957(-)
MSEASELLVQAMPLAITLRRDDPQASAKVTVYNTLVKGPLKVRIKCRHPKEYTVVPKNVSLDHNCKVPITFHLSANSDPSRKKDAFQIQVIDPETERVAEQIIKLTIVPSERDAPAHTGGARDPAPGTGGSPEGATNATTAPSSSSSSSGSSSSQHGKHCSESLDGASGRPSVRWSAVLPIFVAVFLLFQVITPLLDDQHHVQLWAAFLLGCAVTYLMMRGLGS